MNLHHTTLLLIMNAGGVNSSTLLASERGGETTLFTIDELVANVFSVLCVANLFGKRFFKNS